MKKYLKSFVLLFAIYAGAVSCSPSNTNKISSLTQQQMLCDGFTINNQKAIYWAQGFPIRLQVSSSFPETHYEAVRRSVEIWNTTFNTTIFELNLDETVNLVKPIRDGRNIIYWTDNWIYEEKNPATTFINLNSNNIYESDIALNIEDYNLSLSATTANEFDLTSILVHELGHVVGLKHDDVVAGSIMQMYLLPGEVRQTLSTNDIKNIQCMYLQPTIN